MGLSDVRKSHKSIPDPETRAKRGFNGLPKAGKELIEDGTVYLWLQSKAEKFDLVFWTVTLPTQFKDGTSLQRTDYELLLEQWPELCRQVFQEVCRLLRRKGLPDKWLYVVEPQEERWKRYGILAPHIHAVLPNRWNRNKANPTKDKGFQRSGYWEVTTAETDGIVERIISHVLGRPVDCSSACNLDRINRMQRLFFYLSKLGRLGSYLSKGSKLMAQLQSSSWSDRLPPNWYGSDLTTRQQVRASIHTTYLGDGTFGELKQELEQISEQFEAENGRPLFTTPHLVDVETEEGMIPVAVVTRVHWFTDIEYAMEAIAALDLTALRRDFDDSQNKCA